MPEIVNGIKRIGKWTALPAFSLMILTLMIINFFIANTEISSSFISSFLNTNTAVICVCIGVSVVIISGGIDISLGGLVSLCNVVAVQLMMHNVKFYWAIIIVLLMAVIAGAFNGFVVSLLHIPPLLTTFATQTIFSGLALLVMPTPGGKVAKELTRFYYNKIFGIFPKTLLFILLPVAVWKIYKHTAAGIKLYAVGLNANKAYLSGINLKLNYMFAYCFAGFSAGVGALAMTSYVGAGAPDLGASFDMTAISAAVIGGVSLAGGKGDVAGGIFGCLFLGLLTNLIVSLRVNAFAQDWLKAAILLAGVLLAVAIEMWGQKTKRVSDVIKN